MGLFDAITGSVVMKYKVETDQAKAKIKELSGEQKKAAKEAAEALEKQGKAAESMASQYAKGAAIIVGGFMAAKDGLAQFQKETRLATGAAGVDIDALSDSWDGLKTRMDLLAFAQAGHQGAWKLTTGQLQAVTEGMRALEKKGFETGAVFDKFTEVIKKGKLEGLDDFGLSLKSTGDQSQDLKILMNALGKEVLSVGGSFERAGDDAQRAIVKMDDGLTTLRTSVGWLTDKFLGLGVAIGNSLGRLVYGDLAPDTGTGGRADVYAQQFSQLRGGRYGRSAGGAEGLLDSAANLLPGPDVQRYLIGGPGGADQAAGRTLANFKSNVNKAMQNWGPLATASPEEFANLVSGLPQDWRKVDDQLAANVDALGARLNDRFQKTGAEALRGIVVGFKNELAKNRGSVANSRGRGGRGKAKTDDDWLSGALDSAIGTASAFGGYLGDVGAANQNRAREDEIAQQRWAATMEQNRRWAVDMAALNDQLAKDKEESFLTKVFGPIEDFDTYTFALTSIGDLTKNVWGGIITTIANGEELSGKAIRKMIAQTLGAKASELGADGLIAVLRGTWKTVTGNPTGPAEVGAGLAMMAGAVTIAGIARGIGGSATVPSASGGGARGGRNQDHRGSGGGEWRPAGQQTVIVLGSDYGDNSQRVRERNAYAAFSRTATVYQPPRGAAA